MASKIEWTQETWNPVIGCTKVSVGCANCYAERMAGRLWHIQKEDGGPYSDLGCYNGRWNGNVITIPKALNKPLHWKKPKMIFVCSVSDLFHEKVGFDFIYKVFEVMLLTPHHKYFVLTKRSEQMKRMMPHVWFLLKRNYPNAKLPLENVIGMVTVENQEMADKRVPDLLASSFYLRGLSAEPLLGEIDLRKIHWQNTTEIDALNGTHGVLRPHGGTCDKINLCIVGGESGHNARPMHPDWARSIRDQCKDAGVPFFFKQWGEWGSQIIADKGKKIELVKHKMETFDMDNVDMMVKVGKKKAGRLLDGRTHDELPWGNDV